VELVIGILTVVSGLLVLGHPLAGLAFLTLLLAAYFLVDGVFTVVEAFQVRPRASWGWTLFSGVASIVLAYLIWREWPLTGAWAIGLLIGLRLLFSGWALIALGTAAKRLADVAGDS
jgi:uncharacterized membrane protein HdeD (DUF308 family)